MKITTTGYYGNKDAAKAKLANKFIGRGSAGSSTESYRLQLGELANCGKYTPNDVVFVSANGMRPNRVEPDWHELKLACVACATFITDKAEDRNRPYNVGERDVARFLVLKGYTEETPGMWIPEYRDYH